jgi:hypothetical protein
MAACSARIFSVSLVSMTGAGPGAAAHAEEDPMNPEPRPPRALTVVFPCPRCGTAATVSQVQGDRCTGCAFEFKWFQAPEVQTARDYHEVLTGEKYLLELADGRGWIVAHF